MMVFQLVLLLAFVVASFAQYNETLSAWDNNQAQISLWLSAAAYCGKSAYKTHTFKGPTTGFVVTYIIYDSATDTQGYIGYLPSDKSIYVTYRGSQDIRNWVTNLDAFKTAYTTYPECNCQVHKGFFNTEQKVISGVLSEVKRLKGLYGSYAVKVTGHSLGAALAQLTSMDLIHAGIAATVYNFGQPRVGDKAYASFATNKVTTWRVTHNKDIVPHVPFTTEMDFYHACREEFEDVNHKLKTCDTSCEDQTCADQFKTSELTIDDHLVYLNMGVNCDAVSATL
jgi:hypothetical protein